MQIIAYLTKTYLNIQDLSQGINIESHPICGQNKMTFYIEVEFIGTASINF